MGSVRCRKKDAPSKPVVRLITGMDQNGMGLNNPNGHTNLSYTTRFITHERRKKGDYIENLCSVQLSGPLDHDI